MQTMIFTKYEVEDNNSKYSDSHCHRFTPFTFKFIIDILYEANLIDVKIQRLYKTLHPLNIYNGTPGGRLNRDLRATLPINELKDNPL